MTSCDLPGTRHGFLVFKKENRITPNREMYREENRFVFKLEISTLAAMQISFALSTSATTLEAFRLE
jgi:hypothetical protein